MRKLIVLVAAAVFAAGTAHAAVFDAGDSWLQLKIAGLERQDVVGSFDGTTTQAVLTGAAGAESVALKGGEFSTVSKAAGVEFFTGTPNITNLFLTVSNGAGTFAGGFSGSWNQGALPAGFGGNAALVGDNAIEILNGAATIPVPLNVVGAGGQATATIGLLTATIFVDGAPWITGEAQVTGILTNVGSITNGTRQGVMGAPFTLSAAVGENITPVTENGLTGVRVVGSESLSGTAPGSVQLVTPIYVDAGAATGRGPIPAAAFLTLRWVPEPGTMLLLGSAVAGLLVVGRKQMKR